MQRFLAAHVAAQESSGLLAECLSQLGSIPPEASLGFIYASAATAPSLPAILNELRCRTPGVEWLGCCGEGVCGGDIESYDTPALSLLLTDIPPEQFRLLSSNEDLFAELPREVAAWCERHHDCNGLLHAVPTYMATSAFAAEIRRHAPQARLNGGLSSGAGQYRHIENGVHAHGISGVLLSNEVPLLSAHTQGCTPIGEPLSVDQAHQNLVVELAGRPAQEVLKEAVGEVLWRDPQRLGNYIFVGLPTAAADGGEDYMVRNLLGLDSEGQAIAVGDLMEQHRQLRFCRRDGNAAREDMVAMLQRLRQQVGERTIRGGIYISCIGRGRRQFGDNSEELKLISRELGEFPLAGFFANGEFYQGRLYSYTGVLTLFLS